MVLTAVLKELTQLHQLFNELAKEKTEAVRKGQIEDLEKIMKQETACIHQLKKLEEKRQRATSVWLETQGLVKENVTVEEIIPYLDDEEQKELTLWQTRLLEQITMWKEQNDLNEQLIEESLRFVNMSLDVFQPNRSENYSRPDTGHSHTEERRSIFDSKA
ncbi:flagellar protein FlgN [Alteribacter keqinensis]|uniref:flagellar protein FlgN n=1 Tax=Alteribacter keqinensis TaxID=2483800 RepID=UPI0016059D62|nr:flagellar protein FlgN [Alteribacter keqinensis]